MKPLRVLLLLLALLLGLLQYKLWFGNGGQREVEALRARVAGQEAENLKLQQRNEALKAEVENLKSGEAAVEERARSELERYERENVGWPPREPYEVPISRGVYSAIVYAALMLYAHVLKENHAFGVDWVQRKPCGFSRSGQTPTERCPGRIDHSSRPT